jgi:1-aminocyclopropane-1-carboxylate deaminase
MPASIPVAVPPLDPLDDPVLRPYGVQLAMLRLDRLHPLVNGNKWFKLKHDLAAAAAGGQTTLLSFGGAYSNHIRALSAAARLTGFYSIGIIRGELVEPLNPVLAFARAQGMELVGISRSEYRRRQDPAFINGLLERFGNCHVIPEGGSAEAGIRGCEEIMAFLAPLPGTDDGRQVTVACACGTGSTLAGLVRGGSRLDLDLTLLGIAVLKGAGYLARQVRTWLAATPDTALPAWQLCEDYHRGGYGKTDRELQAFIDGFQRRTGVPLEPVYTGKLVYGLYDMIRRGDFPSGSRIICLHTGGVYK